MKEEMHIALCTNSRYVIPTLASMRSFAHHNSNVHFHIFHDSLSKEEILNLKSIESKYKCIVDAVQVDGSVFQNSPVFGRSREAYYRLLIPQYLESGIERCLYVDSDTLCNGNIDEFYNLPFDGKALIAVQDIGEMLLFRKERHNVLHIPTEYEYFNSGVLVFNVTYWKENVQVQPFVSFIQEHAEKLTFLDQDVLNAFFFDKVKIVSDIAYNYMEILFNQYIFSSKITRAKIIHYVEKPWNYTYKGVQASLWWKFGKIGNKRKHYMFKVVNTVFRITLALVTICIPVQYLKKLKNRA